MTTQTANLERERLLQLAEEYREKGYEISFEPNPEDLPDFLKNYRPDMIVRRGDEAVIVEVKSRRSLNASSRQYLQTLVQSVEQHPGWRFELVMTNPEDVVFSLQAESPLQKPEIETRLQVARKLAMQHPESAILYAWSLVEATLRLVAEHERMSLQRLDPLYLVKQLMTEGVISRPEYQLLIDGLSLRNAIAHGFKANQVTKGSVYQLIDLTELLLKTLQMSTEADQLC
ncbi:MULTISPECIES: YraN family protein [Cyanophyceae]|uniref:YraN family protein n=2 Tax=Cyanophyceae TaxID=3028117 RepID=UPI00117D69FB|nr:YraN family protein [Synechococcus sp. 7002]